MRRLLALLLCLSLLLPLFSASTPGHAADSYLITIAENGNRSIYDVQARAFIENAFSDSSLRVHDIGKYGFIMERTYYGPEDETGSREGIYKVCSFVTVDALADGLQESDLLDFYTYQFE